MAASVLKTKRTVEMSIYIVCAFVRLREFAIAHRELAEKLEELEQQVGKHDVAIQTIMEAIRKLMQPPEKPKRKIGFQAREPRARYGTN